MEQRHQDILVHTRLSNMLPLTGAGGQRVRYGDKLSHRFWVQFILAQFTDYLGLGINSLPFLSRHAIGGENSVPHAVFLLLPARERCIA